MAEHYSFFNSKNHDRVYNASDWADYFVPFFKPGVFNGCLQVVANGGMTVKINEGYAWIDGYKYHLDAPLVIDIETASGSMNRKDNIVVRLDLTNKWVRSFRVTGAYYSEEAMPPEPDISARIHELVIARINVAAGTTEITQDMIEDTRMDGDLCGWVCGTVEQIEFEQIYSQFKAFQELKKEEFIEYIGDLENELQENTTKWANNFTAWLENLKQQLDEDAAGNLQNQINSINAVLREISDEEIDAIVAGTYESTEGGMEPDTYSRVTSEEIENAVNNAFEGSDEA